MKFSLRFACANCGQTTNYKLQIKLLCNFACICLPLFSFWSLLAIYFKLFLIWCITQSWTSDLENIVLIASENPFNPSTQTTQVSRTHLFLRSVNTDNQKLAPSLHLRLRLGSKYQFIVRFSLTGEYLALQVACIH